MDLLKKLFKKRLQCVAHASTQEELDWESDLISTASQWRWQMEQFTRNHQSLSFLIHSGGTNPLQCSCLVNPRDGGASWAAVYGAAQSRT